MDNSIRIMDPKVQAKTPAHIAMILARVFLVLCLLLFVVSELWNTSLATEYDEFEVTVASENDWYTKGLLDCYAHNRSISNKWEFGSVDGISGQSGNAWSDGNYPNYSGIKQMYLDDWSVGSHTVTELETTLGQEFLQTAVFPMFQELVNPFRQDVGSDKSWEENLLTIDLTYNGIDAEYTYTINQLSTLTFDSNGGTAGNAQIQAGKVMSAILDIAKYVALALLLATFAVGFMQSFLEGNQYDEILWKKFTTLGLCIAGIFLSSLLSMYIINLGTGMVHVLFNRASSFTGNTDDYRLVMQLMWNNCNTGLDRINIATKTFHGFIDLIKALGYMFVLLVPWLASVIAGLFIWIICFERAIESLVMIAVAPFAFIDFTGHSPVDRIMRFLRQVMTLALQGLIIAAVLFIASAISSGSIVDSILETGVIKFSSFTSIVVLAVVKASICGKSRQIAQAVVG